MLLPANHFIRLYLNFFLKEVQIEIVFKILKWSPAFWQQCPKWVLSLITVFSKVIKSVVTKHGLFDYVLVKNAGNSKLITLVECLPNSNLVLFNFLISFALIPDCREVRC